MSNKKTIKIENNDEVVGIDLEKKEILLLKSLENVNIDEKSVLSDERIISDYRSEKDDYTQILDYLVENYDEIRVLKYKYFLEKKEKVDYLKDYSKEIIEEKKDEIDEILEKKDEILVIKDIYGNSQREKWTVGLLRYKELTYEEEVGLIEDYIDRYLEAWYKGTLTELHTISFDDFEKGKYTRELDNVYYINSELLSSENKLIDLQEYYYFSKKYQTKKEILEIYNYTKIFIETDNIEKTKEITDNIETLDYKYINIPEEMKKENRWAIIKIISPEEQIQQIQSNKKLSEEEKIEKISKIKKARKIPISTTGELASSIDKNTWSSYKEATEFIKGREQNHTLAFALGEGYIGIDLDDILQDGREYMQDKENSKSMTADFLRNIDTYAEISPSGKGLHLIGYGELPGEYKRQGNLEIYDKDRFFTVTGNIIRDKDRTEIININDSLKPLYDKYIGSRKSFKTLREVEKINSNITEDKLLNLMLSPDKNKNLSKEDLLDIYKGNWEKYSGIFPSQSEVDWYMSVRAIYFSSGDIEKSKNILLKSGLYRDKWETTRGRGVPYIDYLLNKAFQTVDFSVKNNLTAEQQTFINQVKKSEDLSFLSNNNYNYYKENIYKNMNNAILNTFKEAHNYSSNKWITANQIKQYNEELTLKKDENYLAIKNVEDFCEVNLNVKDSNNERKFIKIKLYNIDNVLNASEKNILDYELQPIKNIQQLTIDKPEMEATFISALLGEKVILDREVIEKTSDEDILKAFKNANNFVNDVTKKVIKESDKEEEKVEKKTEEKGENKNIISLKKIENYETELER